MNQYQVTFTLIAVSLLSVAGAILVAASIRRQRSSSQKQNRLSRFVSSVPEESGKTGSQQTNFLSGREVGKFRDWINESLSSLSSKKLQIKLSSAYWPITDTEYILVRVVAIVMALLLGGLIFSNFLAGIFLAAIAILVPPILLERAIAQRQQKFQDQLLDVLILIKGAVQAGYGLMQAIDIAVKEIPAPSSEEFGRILYEIRLGISLERALINLAERMESDDLQIVVTAVIINAQVGGNLSTVLEAAISTIRDRMQLLGEIRSLTSYARYVGNFLSMLPFLAGLIIFFLSPGYFDTVKTSFLTQILLGSALVSVVIGNIWVRQIVKITV